MPNARKDNLYFGVAGQYAVMSELLARGYNVARPDVDVGDDIISVRDRDGEFTLIQVKAANATRSRNAGLRARYLIREDQIKIVRPFAQLYFAFVIRSENRWVDFVLLPHEDLRKAYIHQDVSQRVGRLDPKTGKVAISLVRKGEKLYCAGRDPKDRQDWSEFRNNWDGRWPKVEHRAASAT